MKKFMKDMLQQAECDWQKHKYTNSNHSPSADIRRKTHHNMAHCSSYCRHQPYPTCHPPPTYHPHEGRNTRRDRRFSSSSSCPSTPPTLYSHQHHWPRFHASGHLRNSTKIPVIELKNNTSMNNHRQPPPSVYVDGNKSSGCSCCT